MITSLLHPSRKTLAAFATGDLPERRPVARHLEHCEACRRFVGFTQRLEKSLGALPSVESRDDLLVRALADRDAGGRAILPLSDDIRRVVRPSVAARIGAVIAAAVVVALWSSQRFRAPDVRGANELLLAGFVPRIAEASERLRPAGALTHSLTAVDVTFQRRVVDSATGRASNGAILDFHVAPTAETGMWVVTARWRDIDEPADMQNARASTESVTVIGASLTPSRRIIQMTPFRRWAGIRIDQRFRNDSVVGQMSLDEDPTRRPIAHDLRAERQRLLASDALGPVYFMGVPVVPAAEFDVSVLGWAVVPNDVLVPTHMKVLGSERVTTPAGAFDCWKIAITAGSETHFFWVRKSDHLGVLTRRRLSDGRIREVALLREGADR